MLHKRNIAIQHCEQKQPLFARYKGDHINVLVKQVRAPAEKALGEPVGSSSSMKQQHLES